jgi:hypothetical protein
MNRLARVSAVFALSAAVITVAAAPAVAAAGIPIKGGSQQLRFNHSVRHALKASHIKLAAVSPSSFNGKVLTSPITGGTLSIAQQTAIVDDGGGLMISKGHKHVAITKFHSDGTTGVGTAKVSGHGRVKALVASKPTSVSGSDPVTASGYTVTMAAPLVKILDKKFHTKVFKKHAKLGTGSTTLSF